jgi:hypothetical protein
LAKEAAALPDDDPRLARLAELVDSYGGSTEQLSLAADRDGVRLYDLSNWNHSRFSGEIDIPTLFLSSRLLTLDGLLESIAEETEWSWKVATSSRRTASPRRISTPTHGSVTSG